MTRLIWTSRAVIAALGVVALDKCVTEPFRATAIAATCSHASHHASFAVDGPTGFDQAQGAF